MVKGLKITVQLYNFNGALSILCAQFRKISILCAHLFSIIEKIFVFYKPQKDIYQCEYMCILIYYKKTNLLQVF